MYAIIQNGSQQLRITIGQTIWCEKLPEAVGEKHLFTQVLLWHKSAQETLIGQPYVAANVIAEVTKQGLGKKLHIYKYKAKHRARRRFGHRQAYTRLVIQSIQAQ